MEFALDEAQVELQQTVARFCADRFPLDALAAREGAPVDRAAWAELAALGVLGLLLPEDDGGSGLGPLEAVLVFEQLGAHLVPGPMLWTVLAAPIIQGAARGDVVVGGIEASATVDGAAIVEHAADLDVLLVVHDDAIVAHRVDDLAPAEPLNALDPSTPVGRVALDAHPAPDRVGDGHASLRLRTLGTVLSAALLTGLASRALEVARAHALERQQFDAPIGSFQAVKHLLADMYVAHGLAQSATYAAAAVVHDPGNDDPVRAAGAAKLLAADAAIGGASTAIQVLGGMGFTWEMLPNHLLKRAWVLHSAFGTADDHAEHLGAALAAAVGG